MKILFLTQFLPYYPNTGGKIKTWSILQLLCQKHKVHLVSFADKKSDLSGLKEVERICQKVDVVINPIITQAHQDLRLKVILSLFSTKPFRVLKHFSPKIKSLLEKALSTEKFDVIYFDHDVMLQYLPLVKRYSSAKLIFDEHNISSSGAWQNFKIETRIMEKAAYLLEALKWASFEKKYFKQCDYIFSISNTDKDDLINKGVNPKKVSFLPIPVKKYKKHSFINQSKILFVGLMSWKPNDDGFWWFYRKVMPLVAKNNPKTNIIVIGSYPSSELRSLPSKDATIRVLGYVKNIDKYFDETSVFIVPIRSGSGIRIKLLEALSRGIPTVSTSIGAEGIAIRSGSEVLLADTPQKFAQSVLELMDDQKLSKMMSINAQKFISRNYSKRESQKAISRCPYLRKKTKVYN